MIQHRLKLTLFPFDKKNYQNKPVSTKIIKYLKIRILSLQLLMHIRNNRVKDFIWSCCHLGISCINIFSCNLNKGLPNPDFNHTQSRHAALAGTLLALEHICFSALKSHTYIFYANLAKRQLFCRYKVRKCLE